MGDLLDEDDVGLVADDVGGEVLRRTGPVDGGHAEDVAATKMFRGAGFGALLADASKRNERAHMIEIARRRRRQTLRRIPLDRRALKVRQTISRTRALSLVFLCKNSFLKQSKLNVYGLILYQLTYIRHINYNIKSSNLHLKLSRI